MKVLVTGSRDFPDRDMVFMMLSDTMAPNGILIHGACPTGADYYASQWAACQPDVYEVDMAAKWKNYGRPAGHLRNAAMLTLNPDVVLAFYADQAANAGTTDCVQKARLAKVPLIREFWDTRGEVTA